MRGIAAIIAGGIALSWPAYGASQRTTENAEATAIRSKLTQWVSDYNSGKIIASNRIWDDGLQGWWPGLANYDNDTIRRMNARGDPKPPKNTRWKLKIVEIIVDHDLAVVRDRWEEYHRANADTKWALARKTLSFEVWRKGEQGWKISRYIVAPLNLEDARDYP
jgi:hypothetical protein